MLLKAGVVFTFIVEIVAPLALLLPFRELRVVNGTFQFLLQAGIAATGNYNFFNLLTIVLNLTSFDDDSLSIYLARPAMRFFCFLSKSESSYLAKRRKAQQECSLCSCFGVLLSVLALCVCFYLGTYAVHFGLPFSQEDFSSFLHSEEAVLYVRSSIGCSLLLFFLEALYNHLSAAESELSLSNALYNLLLSFRLLAVLSLALIISIFLLSAQYHTFWQSLGQDKELFSRSEMKAYTPQIWNVALRQGFNISERKQFEIFKELKKAMYTQSLANPYGLFRRITGVGGRPELLLQGSDGEASEDGRLTWKTYEFHYKPTSLKKSPPWVAPLQPRIDW